MAKKIKNFCMHILNKNQILCINLPSTTKKSLTDIGNCFCAYKAPHHTQ